LALHEHELLAFDMISMNWCAVSMWLLDNSVGYFIFWHGVGADVS